MKTLYLQCFAGISGDMFLGALLDAGLDESKFREMLKNSGLIDQEILISKVLKKGITATSLQVVPQPNHRHLHVEDIREMITKSALREEVVQKAMLAFERIIGAESQVHGVPVDQVHLHEVSGLDTFVDIVGTAWGLDHLGIRKVFSTPVNVGSGTVTFSHGTYPVPAPATAILLKNIPVVLDGLPGERTTPTGAALAATFIDSYDLPGDLTPTCVGYGAGNRDDGDRPNVLRAMICRMHIPEEEAAEYETLTMIETDIDDDSPEILGYLSEKLMAVAGVLDVSVIASSRKKNRMGQLFRILCLPGASSGVRQLLFQESSSLGCREFLVRRFRQKRHIETVETPWGPVRVVCTETNLAPEFEDCRKCAEVAEVPIRQVYIEALSRLHTGRSKQIG